MQIIDDTFEEAVKNFKPIFGHQEHIHVAELMEKLNLKLKPKEIDSVKSKIIYLIKTYG